MALSLISRLPGSVHLQPSRVLNAQSTGSEPGSYVDGPSPRNRRRKHLEHKITSIKSTDKVFGHFERKAEENSDSRFVFLLWGSDNSKESSTYAIDVPISDPDAEDSVFFELKKAYYAQRGRWRKYLSLRHVAQVKPVKFRFINNHSRHFSVHMESLDVHKIHEEYSMKQGGYAKAISSLPDSEHEFPDKCYFYPSLDTYCHGNESCPVNNPPGPFPVACPFEDYDHCVTVINWTKTLAFLTYYFEDPMAARGQNILQGFSQMEYIYPYRNIKFLPSTPYPQRRYEEWNGLYLKEIWRMKTCVCTFGTLVAFVLLTGKLVWGTWEITFAAGAFFIAMPMLTLAALSYYK